MKHSTQDIAARIIRARVLETAERCTIKRNGEVHAYGQMPNSISTGWYLVGDKEVLYRQIMEERA